MKHYALMATSILASVCTQQNWLILALG